MEKIIGKRIQELRKKKGITQEELSEIIDISPHYLSALERGVYNIKLSMLVKMLNVLDCSADEVFCDVVNKSCTVTSSRLSKELETLSAEEQKRILAVVDTMINSAKKAPHPHITIKSAPCAQIFLFIAIFQQHSTIVLLYLSVPNA